MRGTDRQSEETYLKNTLSIIDKNLQDYSSEVTRMQAEIDEMLEHYHDADVELWTLLNNTITLNEHMKRALHRNERAKYKPYFGRIIFRDQKLDKTESLYIGKGGIAKDRTTQIVVDWRAPVANAYYENGLGNCSYHAPDGSEIPIDLKLKRTFEIEDGRLLDYVDTEVVSNDDLLMKYLSKNKEAVLGEIVATIQKEQNEIIRKSPYHNCLVQGVAGSGKTTVAMHRISYILYNYKERFRPEDFYIVGSNRILLNYITGVLPDLDVYGVRQMTMDQLMIRLLYEDWDNKKYKLKAPDIKEAVKGTEEWYRDLLAFIQKLESEMIKVQDVTLNPRQFVEGLLDGKNGVYDRTEEDQRNGIAPKLVRLMQKDAVERYLEQNPYVSIQCKINMLNERLTAKIQEEFLNRPAMYSEVERKAIFRAYRAFFGEPARKESIYMLYQRFLQQQIAAGHQVNIPDKALDVYDLAALALLYKLVKETEVISEAHHIVIDEAQDFGMMIYRVLDTCIKDCTYTIMGDTSQNIHFGFGLGDWNALRKLFIRTKSDSFNTLRKSYRNTIEISEFATNILRHGTFPIYPVEPIIRHGKPVSVQTETDTSIETLGQKAAEICKAWQRDGYDTIAVICRNEEESKKLAPEMSKHMKLLDWDPESASFGNGVSVLPVELTKGLEFDTVLLFQPTSEAYPSDNGHARLLYVACTRALHELSVLCAGSMTELLAEPASGGHTATFASEDEEKPETNSPAQPIAENRQRKSTVSVAKRPVISVRSVKPLQPAQSSASGQALTRLYSSNPVPKAEDASPQTAPKANLQTVFGDMPSNDMLKPVGHARINQSIRWVTRQQDGYYFQSQYGILRITPIGSAIFRITFCKGSSLKAGHHPLIAIDHIDKTCRAKDSIRTFELTTPEVRILIDKPSGSLQFQDGSGKLLFTEKQQESRQAEGTRSWWYLTLQKGEKIYATDGQTMLSGLKSSARLIAPDASQNRLPLLLSDRGYGIVPACSGKVIFCDIPAYGTYLCEEGEQADYYVIAGRQQSVINNAFLYLCGLL